LSIRVSAANVIFIENERFAELKKQKLDSETTYGPILETKKRAVPSPIRQKDTEEVAFM